MLILGTDGPIATASKTGNSTVTNFKSDGAFFQTSPSHRQDFGASPAGCSTASSSYSPTGTPLAGVASEWTSDMAWEAQSGAAAWGSSITGMLTGRAEWRGSIVVP